MAILKKIREYSGKTVRGIRNFYLRRMGVEIGEDVYLSWGAKVDVGRGKVIIKDKARITNGTYILSHTAVGLRVKPEEPNERTTIIGKNSFIGVNSIIMPGVEIGEYSVVGAGSVVTKDVPPETIVAGNPAKKIQRLERN